MSDAKKHMPLFLACICAVIGISDIKAFWRLRETILKMENMPFAGMISSVLLKFCSLIRRRYGAGIPITKYVKPFATPHAFHGIFISEYAHVEEGCTIFQQVTIGQNGLISPDAPGGNAPVIEANCYIGAGAKIIGPCHIGTDVRIGANAIVVDDIPDHATVVLQKPRIIVR
jgi:serine O-acetyltransferase